MKISTATSRFSTDWANQELTWAQLKAKLAITKRTAETVAEYRALPKMTQDKIKDVGGFVGGWLQDGKRRANSVICRSLLTLDLDYARPDFWDSFILLFDLVALCYSTHKHTPEAPRLRLVVPLSRDVTPDEYEAIARKLAEEIGIDQFDDTTYQASRLMYWPSTSKDGAYFFQAQEGAPLNVDEYLAKYTDWTDVTSWPTSSRQSEALRKRAAKAEDPLGKDGVIGAFCRSYTIQDAIEEFLPEVYRPGASGGRYTFIGGSTANGLVTYSDRFAYSNHSTDPAGGKLCNAFDLVRIHKFGHLDKDTSGAVQAPSKLPSFQAMAKWVTELAPVKEELLAEVFGEDTEPEESQPQPQPQSQSATATATATTSTTSTMATTGDPSWKAKLEFTSRGNLAPTINNAVLILENDPRLNGLGRFNAFRQNREGNPDLPWDRSTLFWNDSDDANLHHYLETKYSYRAARELEDAIKVVFNKRSYHPVRAYLAGLPAWDGVPRLDTLLTRCLLCDNTPYVRAVSRKTFVAAVARVLEPGCKFDYMLTIIGPQGAGKSLLIDIMGGDWYSDTIVAVSGKDAYDGLEGVWIQEIGELSSFKKAEVEQVKAYITKRSDRYRKAYAHNADEYPRQNIFIGTSNDSLPLRDDTGNRRFWVVESHQQAQTVTPDLLRLYDKTNKEASKERDLLWSEALYYYNHGETLDLPPELKAVATEIQAAHHQEDPRLGLIRDYLDIPLPANWSTLGLRERVAYIQGNAFDDGLPTHNGTEPRQRVCALEVWCECLGKPKDSMNRYEAKEINLLIEQVPGWQYAGSDKFGVYGSQRGYRNKK